MSWDARVVLDSISPAGARVITSELTYPLIIHNELLTHRVLSRSAASNRAIPATRLIEEVKNNPFVPIRFGRNTSGMQDKGVVVDDPEAAKAAWLCGRDSAVAIAEELLRLKVHKQLTNRVLGPYQWITTIVTSTSLAWMWKLRHHADAQPEFYYLMQLWGAALKGSRPVERLCHFPYLREDEVDRPIDEQKKISTARCARISYLTRDETRPVEAEFNLYDRLLQPGADFGHMGPFEHPALALADRYQTSGNFIGWMQHREEIRNNYVTPQQEQEFMDTMRA